MVVQTSDGSFSQKARNMRNNKIGGGDISHISQPRQEIYRSYEGQSSGSSLVRLLGLINRCDKNEQIANESEH